MIKWKTVIIRLSILGVIFAAIHLGTAPLISLILRSTVQMVTGSKLEIDELEASPFQTRMATGPVRLGHPGKELENLFDYKSSEIKLDQASLLRKKFIVTTGTIEGLEFGSGRLDSGKVEETESSSPANDYLSAIGNRAAKGLGSLLNQRFEENFETVSYAREILDRWPTEYETLLARGKKLENRIRDIRDIAKAFQDNPLNSLRDLPKVEQAFRDAALIRREIDSLRSKLSQHRVQVVVDRDNLLQAKQRDLDRIEEIKSEKRLNGRSLSQLLVGDTQGQRVDMAIDWIKWLRRTFPHPKKTIKASRGRGETIRFAGQVDQPDLLIRSVKLNGHGTMDQKPYTFTGTLAGVTTQPEIYGKPAFLQLTASGNVDFKVKGMIDRTGKIDHDRIVIEIPSLKIAAQNLKIDDGVRLQLDRSDVHLTARVDLIGDELSGQIKASQKGFNLQVNTDLKNGFARDMSAMLNEDLKTIQKFEVVAKLSGTVSDPHWHLHSDLGPQIGAAVQNTLVRGYEEKKAELIAKLNRETEKSLGEFSALVQKHENLINAFLSEKSKDLVQLQTRVSSLLRPDGLRFR